MSRVNRQPMLVLTATVLSVAVVGTIVWARAFLIPLALATFLAFVLAPAVAYLRRLGLPKVAAVMLVIAGSSSLVVGVGIVLSWQVTALVRELPDHSDKISRKLQSASSLFSGATGDRFAEMMKDIETALRPEVPAKEPMPVVIESRHPTWLTTLEGYFGPAAEALGHTAFTFVLTVFLLLGREDMRNRVIRLIGPSRVTTTTKAVDDAGARISRFLRAQLAVNLGFGVALAVVLLALGVRYAILWGCFAALMRYVPYVGAWMAIGPPMLAAVAMTDGWSVPLALICAFAILEVVTVNVVEPRVFGQSLGLSEVAQVVSAALWAFLWGPIGLVLSGPLTGCLLVLGKNVPQLHSLDVLLSDTDALPPKLTFFQRLLAQDPDDADVIVADYLKDHSPADVVDDLLVPALASAQQAVGRHEIDTEDGQFIADAVREIADELKDREPANADGDAVRITIVPAFGPGDAAAAELLSERLAPESWDVTLLSQATLASEAIAALERDEPAVVVLVALTPGGFPHTRYLCKRLRSVLGEGKLFVGRWGTGAVSETERQALAELGVDEVTTGVAATSRALDTWRGVLASGVGVA